MRARKSRSISLLAGAFAVSALIGAPTAVADPAITDCEAGQVVIDGQCNVPQVDPNNVVAPVDVPNGSGPVMGDPGMGVWAPRMRIPVWAVAGTGTDLRPFRPADSSKHCKRRDATQAG